MILFDLVCARRHRFEAWFRDGATFDEQAGRGEVGCPVCGDSSVRKAPTAPRLVSGRGEPAVSAKGEAPAAGSGDEERAAGLKELRRHIESHFDYVGERFSEEARRIHYGEAAKRSIYGEASLADVRELDDEGIPVLPVPWPHRSDS